MLMTEATITMRTNYELPRPPPASIQPPLQQGGEDRAGAVRGAVTITLTLILTFVIITQRFMFSRGAHSRYGHNIDMDS